MGRSGQPTRDDYSSFAPRIKVVDEWTRDGIAEVRAGMRALRLMMGAVLLAIVLLAVFLAVGASR